jgi:hypothetical protein
MTDQVIATIADVTKHNETDLVNEWLRHQLAAIRCAPI